MHVPAVVLAVIAQLATPVAAQPSVAPMAEAPATTYTQHYGWKIAVIDLVSAATALAGAKVLALQLDAENADGTPNPITGLAWVAATAGYLLGGPIVHSLHGNNRGAAKSFGLRAGLPLLGALVGISLDEEGSVIAGLTAVGMVAAMVIDDGIVARREVRSGGSVAPYAAPIAGGGLKLGLSGAF